MKSPDGPRDGLAVFQPFFPLKEPHWGRAIGAAAAVANVLLFLFYFMLCNQPFVMQPGVRLDLPVAEFTGGAPYASSIVITMAQEDLIFLDDERTTLAGLPAELAEAIHRKPGAALLIEADARVTYESLVRVYSMARHLGVPEIVLATRERSP